MPNVLDGVQPPAATRGVDDLDDRIAWHARELDRLRALRRNRDDCALLAAMARAVGDAEFTVTDLIDSATIDPMLCAALGRLVHQPRQLGKRLAELRASQNDPGEIVSPRRPRLVRVGRVESGCIWKIVLPSVNARGGAD
jgi:hypothetical protein